MFLRAILVNGLFRTNFLKISIWTNCPKFIVLKFSKTLSNFRTVYIWNKFSERIHFQQLLENCPFPKYSPKRFVSYPFCKKVSIVQIFRQVHFIEILGRVLFQWISRKESVSVKLSNEVFATIFPQCSVSEKFTKTVLF